VARMFTVGAFVCSPLGNAVLGGLYLFKALNVETLADPQRPSAMRTLVRTKGRVGRGKTRRC
jgi:hypothetical protein